MTVNNTYVFCFSSNLKDQNRKLRIPTFNKKTAKCSVSNIKIKSPNKNVPSFVNENCTENLPVR